MKNLRLEVGKTYRNRKGEEIRIVDNDGISAYSFKGSDGKWYAVNGRFDHFFEDSPLDLIEEVEKEGE